MIPTRPGLRELVLNFPNRWAKSTIDRAEKLRTAHEMTSQEWVVALDWIETVRPPPEADFRGHSWAWLTRRTAVPEA